jgi:PhzF family phenazine biosynthesis protein
MKYKIYQVDAFTDKVFGGNPAAVCPLDKWLEDELLQKIAMENNLAETVFYVNEGGDFRIRWFTPTVEVDLCGHATLAAAHVLFHHGNYKEDIINFNSRSGILKVRKEKNQLTLDFPADVFTEVLPTKEMLNCFNSTPQKILKGRMNYMLVFASEGEIKNLKPNLDAISQLKSVGAIVTAKGETVDFVSRFFAPQSGINEDPVTGSAHTTLTPYWASVLHKNELTAIQISPRRGYLFCRLAGDRTEISGSAVTYMTGEISI